MNYTMRISLSIATLSIAIWAIACNDATSPAPIPTAIQGFALSSGTAGEAMLVAPTFSIVDQNGNPIPNLSVSITVTSGGGSLISPATTTASTVKPVGVWILGQIAGLNQLTITGGGLTQTISVTGNPGPVEQIDIVQGDGQVALAGTTVPSSIILLPSDKYHNAVPNHILNFTVTGGNGSLASAFAQGGTNGQVIVPNWTLGKSVVPQAIQATNGFKTVQITAAVQSAYRIVVRFWGTPMTTQQQAYFTDAAARISAFVVGDVPNANAVNSNISSPPCGVTGQANLNEVIDDVVIYASIQSIDGAGNILARAGPCIFRSGFPGLPAIGVMEFDVADIGSLGSSLQDVITHEMLHVLGIGTEWTFHSLLTGAGTANVAFTGAQGIAGCRTALGTITCATNVPVENTGGAGTRDSHWRESKFSSELMTGFINAGTNPISQMTIGSLADLGYAVNLNAADAYTIPGGSLRAQPQLLVTPASTTTPWESSLPHAPHVLNPNGQLGPTLTRMQ